MGSSLRAENLKCKRTFARKLVVIAPVCTVLLAFMGGIYFVANGYNWWYVLLFPGFITLLTALVNLNEEKKLHYRAVFAMPVSLAKTWTAKTALIGIYVAAASVIHLGGILLGMFTVRSCPGMTVPADKLMLATLLLIVTSLWQIPLCLFLSKKCGLLFTVLFNVGGGTALNLLTVSKFFWWVCPYSWAARLMCPVLGLLPNGLFAKSGDPMLNPSSIPAGIVLSLALFAVLLLLTADWFRRQEVK